MSQIETSIGSCEVGDVDINREMVKAGLARAYRQYSERYLYEEHGAMRNKAGMWGGNCEPPWEWRKKGINMFIAMNRFRIIKGEEAEFERIWAERETHLDKVPGFIEFSLLRGPEAVDHTLYASHTTWVTEKQFEDWTKSDAFRKAHAKAGASRKNIYMGPPQFEGFQSVQFFSVGD